MCVFRLNNIRILIIALSLMTVSDFAFSQYYVREYTYNASENDSKIDAKKHALSELKKNLIEELGVYIISTSNLTVKEQKQVNQIIFESNTQTISECITQTKIIEETWDGESYYLKASVYVDKDDFLRRLKRISYNPKNISNASEVDLVKENSEPAMSFYGSLDLGIQQLNDDNFADNISIMVGVKLGMLFNNNILLGLYGNVNSEQKYNDRFDKYLRYSEGGIIFGTRLFRNWPLQLSIPVKLGIGGIKYFDDTWTTIDEDKDYYYVIEPGIELDVRVIKSFYVSAGASYKMTDAIVLQNTRNNILVGFAYNLSFKIILNHL